MADERKRVKFTSESLEDEDKEKEDIISAQFLNENVFGVKLGYIKIFHRYRVSIFISDELLKYQVLKCPESVEQNPRCSFVRSQDASNGVKVEVELYAEAERTFQEEMVLELCCDVSKASTKVTVIFLASVFGKHEGTPRLKRGLRCVGYEDNDSSSSSE